MASLSELRTAAKEAGLSPYGNKDELEARLNEAAAKELVDPTSIEGLINPFATVSPNPEDLAAQGTTATMQASAAVSGSKAQEPQESAPIPFVDTRILVPTEEQIKSLGYSDQHNKGATVTIEHARRVLDEIRARYPQVQVKLNVDQETYVFEGGLQGRVTTTIHQPVSALLHQVSGVASTYIREHRDGMASRKTVEGAIGDIGTRDMVYR